MEFALYPGIPLETGTFNVIIADDRLVAGALNASPELRRFMVLFVSGNYSCILPRIDTGFSSFDVRRAFTAHQLLTIIREAYHTIVLVEHDPGVYDGAEDMVGTVAQALRQAARETLVVLCAGKQDRHLNRLMRSADRVFYFAEPPQAAGRAGPGQGHRGRIPGAAQQVLEGI